jgi:glycosyltransferase involved in cell wall biosynthesis
MTAKTVSDRLGIVVIGRNEGARLLACLKSALAQTQRVVYVDSGSTDGSVTAAQSLGAQIVDLDLAAPFTAARARNAGLDYLLKYYPEVGYVQFVDGDCELALAWCHYAIEFLQAHSKAAAVCGRRRERFPQGSIFNLLCDLEWDTPIGEAISCGGDVLMRTVALQQVEGYNPALIAGEEPELCFRLRQQGWQIFRADAEMTLHDAQITSIGQWWKRAVRGGHAYAEVFWMHPSSS